jgi:hypothetical protein
MRVRVLFLIKISPTSSVILPLDESENSVPNKCTRPDRKMHGHRSRSLLRHAHPELCSRTHSPLKSWTNTLNGIDGARSPVVSYVVTTETYLGARAQVNGINKRRWRRWHARRAGRRRTAIIFPPEEAKGRKAPMHGVAGRTRRPSSLVECTCRGARGAPSARPPRQDGSRSTRASRAPVCWGGGVVSLRARVNRRRHVRTPDKKSWTRRIFPVES